ncbi:MAG: flavin reductase [Candidatus Azobacteroides sp.]|nr:flavin reductase [Candidatus Azobacteroides sp.]
MKRIFGLFLVSCFLLSSCNNMQSEKDHGNQVSQSDVESVERHGEKWDGFEKVPPSDISEDLFMIHKDWMLVSAGTDSLYNTMTASWGGFGTGWEKSVAFMFIRDSRYTYEFLKKDTVYTLSFFDEEYKDVMKMLGRKSGRDTEKLKDSGLTYLKMPSGAPAFREASMIVECRKLVDQPLQKESVSSEEIAKWYTGEPGTHHIFFGEIIGVWRK